MHSALLVVVCVMSFFASRIGDASPSVIINEIVAGCVFTPPGNYHMGPYIRGISWCPESSKEPVHALMNHMKIHCEGMDASFAGEFGSNVRLVYFPAQSLFLLNPVVISKSEEMIECVDQIGYDVLRVMRHERIRIRYIAFDFEVQIIELVNKNACLMQAILTVL